MLAICNAAVTTFVPIQSSNVDVRRSGAEFSYSIEDSKGVALIQNPSPVFAKLRSIISNNQAAAVDPEGLQKSSIGGIYVTSLASTLHCL